MKFLALLAIVFVISGCAATREIVTLIEPKQFNPQLPETVEMKDVEFIVADSAKLTQLSSSLDKDGRYIVMTSEQFNNLVYNVQEVKRYMLQSKELILYYRGDTD